ncbi:MAG: glycosyltransferase [Cyclobacteriaceae bacterium]|nr:glycosyltransferase [Cyclobacteriaceae bacterium]UYN88129.1 MAG: glycosyltransferase [Cyclobacteriaceae bacterium]
MITIILILFLLYLILMIFLLEGWRIATRSTATITSTPLISIVIAVRNEADQIQNLLDDIARQEYPSDKVEVWVVNDHSEDETVEVVDEWAKQYPDRRFQVINLPSGKAGKKAAITEGVNQASGEIILTTDGDCRVSPTWLASVASQFTESAQLLVGAVRLYPVTSVFEKLQMMEFASLIGTGAATLGWGTPTMCNGANLAYRKSAFFEVDGYSGNEQIPSGDDEFLLRKIFRRYPNGIRFNATTSGVVDASPLATWPEFFNQRVRWAGKWWAHGVGVSALLALFIFSFHVSVVGLVVLGFVGTVAWQDVMLLLTVKAIAEGVFLFRVLKFLRVSFNTASFFTLQVVYPLYVIFFALTANFLRADWRGRRI